MSNTIIKIDSEHFKSFTYELADPHQHIIYLSKKKKLKFKKQEILSDSYVLEYFSTRLESDKHIIQYFENHLMNDPLSLTECILEYKQDTTICTNRLINEEEAILISNFEKQAKTNTNKYIKFKN